MKIYIPFSWALAALVALLALPASQAATFSATFNNTSGTNRAMSVVGWNAYINSSATDYSNIASNTGTRIVNSPSAGNPSSSTGYVVLQEADSTTNNTFAILETGLSLGTPDIISWYENSDHANSSVQVLIQLDSGSWYASTQTFTPSQGDSTAFQTVAVSSFTFTSASSAWTAFTLTPGTAMSVSGTALSSDLSFSNITGIGFLISTPGTAITRLDTVGISYTPIPEPSTFAMLIGIAALGMALRRRL